ncbi:trichohyalin isoform X1 [Cololabis saira]|uniref:trichohyalin isoform X1 n=1 Tax=Cololabis saira TaxID=129043 RepID=UPI002AD2892F|nr:trichohyalin isoform X1 [Cololabis saira]XP_061593819.1 trichohyalin isoform X1 [Cololabis saira]
MNWDSQLSSILSGADGSVAKMRARLTSAGNFSKVGRDPGLFPVRKMGLKSDLDYLSVLPGAPPHRQPPPSLGVGVQWADLAAIQSQLQIQNQTIESLAQKLRDLEREKQGQQSHIQTLQEEVRLLQEEMKGREREREDLRRGQSPGLERRMEQWRRQVEHELSRLREQITRGTSPGNLEESFSSKLRREELEHLRRELDQLKTRLRRQEEDIFVQQAEGRETRRQYERSCKTLEQLTDSYRVHSTDLIKTVSDFSHTQQEVRQIRSTVSELKDEVRSLIIRGREQTPLLSAHTSGPSPVAAPHRQSRRVRVQDPESDSEDFSPTPSLAEISSDDLSWVDDNGPELRVSGPGEFAVPGSDVEDDDNDGDDLLDDDSDLSFNDL